MPDSNNSGSASNLVVLIHPSRQEALRNCGVLPAEVFKDFDDLVQDHGARGVDDAVYLWPTEIDYRNGEESGSSFPALFGLPDKGDEGQWSEFKLSHLFRSTVLHVVFIGKKEETEHEENIDDISEILNWVERLDRTTEKRFSEEQARNLRRHLLVVVASGGMITVDAKKLKLFNDRLATQKAIRACFFLDYNLEVENSNRGSIFSRYVWPIMIGRLILRFVIDPPSDNDGILRRGVHLWRAREFRIKYPDALLEDVWESRLDEAYKALAVHDKDSKQGATGGFCAVEASGVGFGKEIGLTIPAKPKEEQYGAWESAEASTYACEILDEARWNESWQCYRKEFESLVLAKRNARLINSRRVFESVRKDPRNVFLQLGLLRRTSQEISAKSENGILEKWKDVASSEIARQDAMKSLKDNAEDFDLMRLHCVPWYMGFCAVIVVSLFCTAAITQIVHRAMGCGMFTSLWLGGLSIVGACVAWLTMLRVHSRAGLSGLNSLLEMAHLIDEIMKDRSKVAFALVDLAQQCRDKEEIRRGVAFIGRILERVRRFLYAEVKSPVLNVFWGKPKNDVPQDKDDDLGKIQVSRLWQATVYEYGADIYRSKSDFSGMVKSKEVVAEAFEKNEASFIGEWGAWCLDSEVKDGVALGNFPAKFFIPRIRSYMQVTGANIVDKLKADLRDEIKKEKDDFGSWIDQCLDSDVTSGYVFASMHVDKDNIKNDSTCDMLFVPEEYKGIKEKTRRRPVEEKASLFASLNLIAFHFQDFHVDFDCTDEGKLVLKVQSKGG